MWQERLTITHMIRFEPGHWYCRSRYIGFQLALVLVAALQNYVMDLYMDLYLEECWLSQKENQQNLQNDCGLLAAE